VRFASGSKLKEIEEWAFAESGLTSMEISSTVESTVLTFPTYDLSIQANFFYDSNNLEGNLRVHRRLTFPDLLAA
jgi:hypothetical protein